MLIFHLSLSFLTWSFSFLTFSLYATLVVHLSPVSLDEMLFHVVRQGVHVFCCSSSVPTAYVPDAVLCFDVADDYIDDVPTGSMYMLFCRWGWDVGRVPKLDWSFSLLHKDLRREGRLFFETCVSSYWLRSLVGRAAGVARSTVITVDIPSSLIMICCDVTAKFRNVSAVFARSFDHNSSPISSTAVLSVGRQ